MKYFKFNVELYVQMLKFNVLSCLDPAKQDGEIISEVVKE